MSTKVIRKTAKEPASTWGVRRSVDKELTAIRDYNLLIDNSWNITPETEVCFFQGEYGGIITIIPDNMLMPTGNYNYQLKTQGVNTLLNGRYEDGVLKFSLSKHWTEDAKTKKCLLIVQEINNTDGNYNEQEVFVSSEFEIKVEKSLFVESGTITLPEENENTILETLHKAIIEVNKTDNSFTNNNNKIGNEGDKYATLIKLNDSVGTISGANTYILFGKDKQPTYKFQFSGQYCVVPEEVTQSGGLWSYQIVWETANKRIISNILEGQVAENFLTASEEEDAALQDNEGEILVDEDATPLAVREGGTYQLSYSGREVDEAVRTIVENDIQLTNLSPELVAEIKTWGGGVTKEYVDEQIANIKPSDDLATKEYVDEQIANVNVGEEIENRIASIEEQLDATLEGTLVSFEEIALAVFDNGDEGEY